MRNIYAALPEAGDAEPLRFEDAFQRATALVDKGAQVRVLYSEEASQIEITRFVSNGIPTSLASGA